MIKSKGKVIKRIWVVMASLILALATLIPESSVYVQAQTDATVYGGVRVASDFGVTDKEDSTHTIQITLKENETITNTFFIKKDDVLTLSAADSDNNGILIGGFTNGSAVSESTTINVTTYAYKNVIDINKSIKTPLPDENENYVLDFNVTAKSLPTVSGVSKDVVLVVDTSLSMGFNINDSVDQSRIYGTYEQTRWYAVKNTVENFASTLLSTNPQNKIAIVTYAKDMKVMKDSNGETFTGKYDDIENYMESFLTKENYDSLKQGDNYSQLLDKSKLGSGTNVDGGLQYAKNVLGSNINGASVVLVTDGVTNSIYNGTSSEYKDQDICINAAKESGMALKNTGASIYSVAVINAPNSQVNEAMGKDSYAKTFLSSNQAEELNSYFKQIIESISSLPFQQSSVTDTLNERFEIVPNQLGVTDNGDGTFTVYFDSAVSATTQTKSVLIRLKDKYKTNEDAISGSAFTNNNCIFTGKTDNGTFSENFKENPAAIVVNPQNDGYTIKSGSVLNDKNVLDNDGTIVKEGYVDVTLHAVSDKLTTEHGTVIINGDGTFEYTPQEGYTGSDSFKYTCYVMADGIKLEKTADVLINVLPLQEHTRTINYIYEDGKTAQPTVIQTVKGEYAEKVVTPKITGYKPNIEEFEKKLLNEDETNVVIYKKDDSQIKSISYKVNYYKDGKLSDTINISSDVWINLNETAVDKSKINTENFYGIDYKFVKTEPENIPEIIKDKETINVYYVKKEKDPIVDIPKDDVDNKPVIDTDIEVNENIEDTKIESNTDTVGTGDSKNVAAWIATLLMAGTAFVVIAKTKH